MPVHLCTTSAEHNHSLQLLQQNALPCGTAETGHHKHIACWPIHQFESAGTACTAKWYCWNEESKASCLLLEQ
jgi:hypothetical protein